MDVWEAVARRPNLEKGFDHGWGWWSHAALPPLPELAEHTPEVHLNEPLDQQRVQGTLQAICELSGFWVAAYSVNPERQGAAESTYTIVCELEQLCASLRVALEQRLEDGYDNKTED